MTVQVNEKEKQHTSSGTGREEAIAIAYDNPIPVGTRGFSIPSTAPINAPISPEYRPDLPRAPHRSTQRSPHAPSTASSIQAPSPLV